VDWFGALKEFNMLKCNVKQSLSIFCFELNEVPEYNGDCGGEKLRDERHGDVGQYMLSRTRLGPYLQYHI
jgi:hypothetical protein